MEKKEKCLDSGDKFCTVRSQIPYCLKRTKGLAQRDYIAATLLKCWDGDCRYDGMSCLVTTLLAFGLL